MNRRGILTIAMVLACVCLSGANAPEEKTRNPFKVEDVSDPDGEDVQEFAKKAKLAADDKDDNAQQWAAAPEGADGKKGKLEGTWDSRWNTPGNDWLSGTAKVKVVGDRVYILYKDQGTYLIDAKRKGTKLIGRYVNVNATNDSTPWVGEIVDDERIDGIWTNGRWDFRRKLPTKKE